MRTSRMPVRILAAALVPALLSGLAACTSPAPSASPSPSPSTGAPTAEPSTSTPPAQAPVVDIAVAAGAVTGRATLDAGGYVFEVASDDPAMVTIIRPEQGYALGDLIAYESSASEAEYAAEAGRFEAETISLGGAYSGPGAPGTFAVTLDAGTYWFVDRWIAPEDPPLNEDDVLVVTVSGETAPTALPEPDAVATANADRSWSHPAVLPATGTLLLRNPTEGTHQLSLDRVPSDMTAQEYLGLGGREMCLCAAGAVSGGREFLWSYDLEPGDYLVVDHSISELGYPQFNGAGASVVTVE